jgi:hypothetical protein
MRDYRIYTVDANGRVIAPSEVLTCETDEEIIQKATSMVDGHDLEIWDGPRVVAKIPSRD